MNWRIPLVSMDAEYAEVGGAVEDAVQEVLRSGAYVLGAETRDFEQALARLVGVAGAVGVGSGTDALMLALRALGIGRGDEVIVPAFTFFATVEAVLAVGARPVFADVEEDGFHIDPRSVAGALTPRTRAVMPVHLFGRCADMAALAEICEPRGIVLVEDAAQAIGAARENRSAGAWGAVGCFSFYPSKNLGAAGDGGGVVSQDSDLLERVRLLRSHGSAGDAHVAVGTTSRLDALQAAVLRVKLPFLKAWNEARTRNARIYAEELAGCPGLALPRAPAGETVVWSQYTLRCRDRERVRVALEGAGIETRHYYVRPVCEEPALGDLCRPGSAFPQAARACRESISVPVRPSCAPRDIREIAGRVREALEASSG